MKRLILNSSMTALVAIVAVLMLPSVVGAQTLGTGAIAGTVRDSSGGVLPGVTVEVASPALIEKVRTAVTDSNGVYRFIDLRPGAYTVTFTLPGFATVVREGIELTAGFTAQVNADLRVGGIEETITVSGAAPVVDVQNVVEQRVFSREVLDQIPVGRSAQAYGALIPGATTPSDVGGVTQGSSGFTIHGGTGDTRNMVAGISFDSPQQQGGNLTVTTNRSSVQEVSVEVGGMSAEAQTGGVQLNFVQKDGGNTFSGHFAVDYSSGGLQQKNLNDALRARGLRDPNALKRLYDYSFGFGGPIKRDKLWFYTAHRWQGSEVWIPVYYNKLPKDSWFYEPDLSKQANNRSPYVTNAVRLTWQATEKQKLSFHFDNQGGNCQCFNSLSATVTPEAAANHKYGPQYLGYGTWTYPATNRLLFEATASVYRLVQNAVVTEDAVNGLIPVIELSTNLTYRARASMTEGTSYYYKNHYNYTQRLVMSYVTGSHAFKTGITVGENTSDHTHTPHGDSLYRFRNGQPAELQMWATPWYHKENLIPIIGAFVQDQWSLRKFTLNLGLRFDSMDGSIPAQDAPAGRWVPARHFDEGGTVLSWRDVSPRLGISYDLFGNGRTAIKGSLGKFILGQGTSNMLAEFNPMNRLVLGATRAWTDANGDFVPQEAELGPISDRNFGTVLPSVSFADDVTRGWGNREATWQGTASIQHELWSGTSINVGYFRTSYANILAVDNRAVSPADFNEYCITAPVDPRLNEVSGSRICGLYDLNPTKFGQVDNILAHASDFGDISRVFNGVDVLLNARFPRGGVLGGGLSFGRTVTDYCALSAETADVARGTAVIADIPNTRFCKITPPVSAGTQVKFHGAYTLPWDFQISGILQNIPGPEIQAIYQVTNAIALPSLGRNLSSGRATVPLIEPGTRYEERATQLDLRFAKNFRIQGARVTGMLDVYNSLNANPILGVNNAVGPSFQNVTAVMAGRLFKFGAQVEF